MDDKIFDEDISRLALLKRGGALALAASALAAMPARAVAAAQAARATTTLSVWAYQPLLKGGYSDVFQTFMNRYHAKHPAFIAKYQPYAYEDYFTKFRTALVSGKGIPDMMEADWSGKYHELIDNKALLRLDPYLTKGFPKFFGGIVNQMTYKGGQYGVAMDQNSLSLAANMDMLKDHGLSFPRTQGELIAAAKKLRANGIQPIADDQMNEWASADHFFDQLAYTDKSGSLSLALRQAEVGKRKWTDPVFLAAAEAAVRMAGSGVYADGSEGLDIISAYQAWTAEKTAFVFPYIPGGIDPLILSLRPNIFNYDFNPFPPPSASIKGRAIGGAAVIWSIPAKSKNIPAALDLLRTFTNPYAARTLLYRSLIPAFATKVPPTQSARFKKAVRVQAEVASRAIFNANVQVALSDNMHSVNAGRMSAKQLVQALQDAA